MSNYSHYTDSDAPLGVAGQPDAAAPPADSSARGGRFGPWAVVTGASDGIGRAFARELARAGTHVVLVARRRDALEHLAAELMAAGDVRTRVVACDLSTREGIEAVIGQTQDLDVGLLVAAAGFGTSGPFLRHSVEAELAMIDVNCRAVAALAHHFGQRFVARREGGIVLLSSILAFAGVPLSANYAATKAYVQSLAEGLRSELSPAGVAVLAVAAGPTATGFADRANLRMGKAMPAADVARVSLAALGRMTTVRPGIVTRVLDGSLRLLPRLMRSRVLGVVMRGMTRHQGTS